MLKESRRKLCRRTQRNTDVNYKQTSMLKWKAVLQLDGKIKVGL